MSSTDAPAFDLNTLLDPAITEVRRRFPRYLEDVEADDDIEIEVCSGGCRTKDEQPALCISREIAVDLWRDAMVRALKDLKAAAFSFVDGPHLDRWRITVTDARGMHRIAQDRFSVTAKIRAALKKNAFPVKSRSKRKGAA